MPIIYHVTTIAEWKAAQEKGYYKAASLHTEGFIHCSQEHQVTAVLERYFKGQKDLIKLVIDSSKLTNKCIFELSPSINDTFPHVYGKINLDAIMDIENIPG